MSRLSECWSCFRLLISSFIWLTSPPNSLRSKTKFFKSVSVTLVSPFACKDWISFVHFLVSSVGKTSSRSARNLFAMSKACFRTASVVSWFDACAQAFLTFERRSLTRLRSTRLHPPNATSFIRSRTLSKDDKSVDSAFFTWLLLSPRVDIKNLATSHGSTDHFDVSQFWRHLIWELLPFR